ncbi:MAG: hypothetical protein RLZZ390_546 [Bacteroidota bacterium]
MKKFLVVLFLLSNVVTSALYAQIKAYPSHWWVGMKHNSLQVMLNKHYLFVDLLLLPTVKPGKLDFVFEDGSQFAYELKSRNKTQNATVHQGVRSNDLIYLIMPDRFVRIVDMVAI